MQSCAARIVALFVLLAPAGVVAEDAAPASGQGDAPAVTKQSTPDPLVLLIRDDTVRTELGCSEDQGRAIDALLKKHNGLLMSVRDVGPGNAGEAARPAIEELRREFAKILSMEQRARLTNLVLQAQGYDSLERAAVAAALKLTTKQQADLAAAAEQFRAAAQALRKSGAGETPEQLQEKLTAAQKERQQQVVGVLSKSQQARYGAMLGEPFDLAKVKASPADAPEFDGVEGWMNSVPLTMESLRGRVVVVHFFAFGCINCIHNYPWYKEWQERLPSQGVTIVGIHTPETATEANNELLKASLEKHGLKFPVAVDKEKKLWQAWSNNIWPTVYIVDKRGRLRYWWYGELDWEGAGNQKVAERQIAQLLAE